MRILGSTVRSSRRDMSFQPIHPSFSVLPDNAAVGWSILYTTASNIIQVASYTSAVSQSARIAARYTPFEGLFVAVLYLALMLFVSSTVPKLVPQPPTRPSRAPASDVTSASASHDAHHVLASNEGSVPANTSTDSSTSASASASASTSTSDQPYVFEQSEYQAAVLQSLFLAPFQMSAICLVGLQLAVLVNSFLGVGSQMDNFGAWVATLPWELMILAVLFSLLVMHKEKRKKLVGKI